MNMFFSLFVFMVAAVTADPVPLVFNPGLLKGQDARFAVVHHGAHFPTGGKLRFLHLVAKLGAEFGEFATEGKGLKPTPLAFLRFDADEVFDHFVGVADCAKWHAGVVVNWARGHFVHHPFTGEWTSTGFTGRLVDMPAAVEFVFTKLTGPMFMKLVEARLPTHVFTFMLHKRFGLVF